MLSLAAHDDAVDGDVAGPGGAYASPSGSSSSPSLFRSPSVTSPLVFDPSLGRALFSVSPAVPTTKGDDADEDAGTVSATAGREELDSWLLSDSPLTSADVARRIVKQLKDRAEALSAVSRGSQSQWQALVSDLTELMGGDMDGNDLTSTAGSAVVAAPSGGGKVVAPLRRSANDAADAAYQAVNCYVRTGGCAPPSLLQSVMSRRTLRAQQRLRGLQALLSILQSTSLDPVKEDATACLRPALRGRSLEEREARGSSTGVSAALATLLAPPAESPFTLSRHHFLSGLEGAGAQVQALVRSCFFRLLHVNAAMLERCITKTGDVSLAHTVMWNVAVDYEHGDHGAVLDARLLPILGKYIMDKQAHDDTAVAGLAAVPWHAWETIPPSEIRACLRDGTLSKRDVLLYMKSCPREIINDDWWARHNLSGSVGALLTTASLATVSTAYTSFARAVELRRESFPPYRRTFVTADSMPSAPSVLPCAVSSTTAPSSATPMPVAAPAPVPVPAFDFGDVDMDEEEMLRQALALSMGDFEQPPAEPSVPSPSAPTAVVSSPAATGSGSGSGSGSDNDVYPLVTAASLRAQMAWCGVQRSAWALLRLLTCLSLGGSMSRLAEHIRSSVASSGVAAVARQAALMDDEGGSSGSVDSGAVLALVSNRGFSTSLQQSLHLQNTALALLEAELSDLVTRLQRASSPSSPSSSGLFGGPGCDSDAAGGADSYLVHSIVQVEALLHEHLIFLQTIGCTPAGRLHLMKHTVVAALLTLTHLASPRVCTLSLRLLRPVLPLLSVDMASRAVEATALPSLLKVYISDKTVLSMSNGAEGGAGDSSTGYGGGSGDIDGPLLLTTYLLQFVSTRMPDSPVVVTPSGAKADDVAWPIGYGAGYVASCLAAEAVCVLQALLSCGVDDWHAVVEQCVTTCITNAGKAVRARSPATARVHPLAVASKWDSDASVPTPANDTWLALHMGCAALSVVDGSYGWVLRPGGRVVVHDDPLMTDGRGSGDYVRHQHVTATVLSYTPASPTALIAYGDRSTDTSMCLVDDRAMTAVRVL